jgi:hypothetical protein
MHHCSVNPGIANRNSKPATVALFQLADRPLKCSLGVFSKSGPIKQDVGGKQE